MKQSAVVVNSIRQRSIVKLPILGIADSQNLANANYSNHPLLWQAAVKDARAAKRNKWRGPAQRGGGRLCRLRVSLKAACQSSTQRVDIPVGATKTHNGAMPGYQGQSPCLVRNHAALPHFSCGPRAPRFLKPALKSTNNPG